MEYLICIALIAVSIVLIVKGGDWFVDSAIWIAEVSHIPHFIVGATIVSFATTLPELMVSAIAAAGGHAEMAVGNAVGSVTANTGLILALTLTITPFAVNRKDYVFRNLMLVGSSALLYILSFTGVLNAWWSILMFLPLIVFMGDNVIKAKKEMQNVKLLDSGVEKTQEQIDAEPKKDKKTIIINIVKFIVGVAAIVGGSKLLVTYGSDLARLIGISEAVIAVTLVAIGTSLPELVTTITAIRKKNSSLSAGNIIGANIIDICLILPVCAIISATKGQTGLLVSNQSVFLDFPFCLGICMIALIPTLFTQKFQRWQGISVITAYVAYLVLCVLMSEGIIFA